MICRVALGVAWLLLCSSVSHAFFLDEGRRFDVRMRTYSQWSVMAQSSTGIGTFRAHDMVQFRLTAQLN